MKLAKTGYQDSSRTTQGVKEGQKEHNGDGERKPRASWNSDVHPRNMGKGGDIIEDGQYRWWVSLQEVLFKKRCLVGAGCSCSLFQN